MTFKNNYNKLDGTLLKYLYKILEWMNKNRLLAFKILAVIVFLYLLWQISNNLIDIRNQLFLISGGRTRSFGIPVRIVDMPKN